MFIEAVKTIIQFKTVSSCSKMASELNFSLTNLIQTHDATANKNTNSVKQIVKTGSDSGKFNFRTSKMMCAVLKGTSLGH